MRYLIQTLNKTKSKSKLEFQPQANRFRGLEFIVPLSFRLSLNRDSLIRIAVFEQRKIKI
jgi:hypothetical protein